MPAQQSKLKCFVLPDNWTKLSSNCQLDIMSLITQDWGLIIVPQNDWFEKNQIIEMKKINKIWKYVQCQST